MSNKKQREPRTEKERLRMAVRWMRDRNHELRCANHELRDANANLRVERDSADVLLGAAMDRLLGGSER